MRETLQEPTRYGGGEMELWISRVLLGGVMLAAAMILSGLALFLAKGQADVESLSKLVDQQRASANFGAILRGIGRGDGKSLMQLGLLALILTPISRVAMSFFFFLLERDRVFAWITAVVLLVLLGGLIGSALTQ
jgi:uncharacterized membrane protein